MGEKEIILLRTPPLLTEPERCSGCGRCVAACPARLYTLELSGHRKLAFNRAPEKCTTCGKCILACPLGLLSN